MLVLLSCFWLLVAVAAPKSLVPSPPLLDVEVYGNHVLDDEAIIKMSGIGQDPKLSVLEMKRKLETSSLFSRIHVNRIENTIQIIVTEKVTWFVLPYFSSDSDSKVYGLAAAKASLLGQNGTILARYQFGTGDHEGSVLARDEFFLNSFWFLAMSFDYEDALHRVFQDRTVVQRTVNQYHGGSIQLGYHLRPNLLLSFNTYIEQHRFEELVGSYSTGLQSSHRIAVDYGNFYVNEGLSRGAGVRPYFETTDPLSDFRFRKYGVAGQIGVFLKGDFNWISRPRFEVGNVLPRYQLFELGGAKLRSYPSQEFRGGAYVAAQNDFLLASVVVWKLNVRPMLYADWAFIQGAGRTGLGTGFQVYFHDVAVPALQFFAGYGFNPNGFSMSAAIGPQF